MAFKKYKVADNAMAKLALPLQETSTTLTLKDIQNIPEKGEWIGTLVRFGEQGVEKMEKVVVKSRNSNVLTVERGFESAPLQRAKDDFLFLNITAEVIKDMQEAISKINLGSKENTSNKKTSIEENKTSNIFFPTIKAVYDWVTGLLNKKADLVNGKVPSSQLPEVQAIDESNLVHRNGDETISGVKTFSSPVLDGSVKLKKWGINYVGSEPEYGYILGGQEFGGNASFSHSWGWGPMFNWVNAANKRSVMKLQQIQGDKVDLYVNDQNWTGEWGNYTPGSAHGINTISGSLRYKQLGNTMIISGELTININNSREFFVALPTLLKTKGACSVRIRVDDNVYHANAEVNANCIVVKNIIGEALPQNQNFQFLVTAIYESA